MFSGPWTHSAADHVHFATVKDPRRLVWGGPNETLYVLKHQQLQRFNPEGSAWPTSDSSDRSTPSPSRRRE